MVAAADDWMLSPDADIAEFSWPETKVQPLEPPTSIRIYHTGSRMIGLSMAAAADDWTLSTHVHIVLFFGPETKV